MHQNKKIEEKEKIKLIKELNEKEINENELNEKELNEKEKKDNFIKLLKKAQERRQKGFRTINTRK